MSLLSFNEFWLILFIGVSGLLLHARKSSEKRDNNDQSPKSDH